MQASSGQHVHQAVEAEQPNLSIMGLLLGLAANGRERLHLCAPVQPVLGKQKIHRLLT